MNLKQLAISTVLVGIVLNAMDTIVYGFALKSTFAGIAGFHNDAGMLPWFIVGDFIGALVMSWFYGIVRGSFSSGSKFGMVTGIVMTFPGMLVINMMITGSPYYLGWIFVIYGVVEYTIAGTVLGMLNKPKAA